MFSPLWYRRNDIFCFSSKLCIVQLHFSKEKKGISYCALPHQQDLGDVEVGEELLQLAGVVHGEELLRGGGEAVVVGGLLVAGRALSLRGEKDLLLS